MASASSPKEKDNVTKDTIQPKNTQQKHTTISSFALKKRQKMQVWNTVHVVPGG